jgi:predicted PurR-regulated permease PerM
LVRPLEPVFMQYYNWPGRNRLAWWLVIAALFVAAAFTAYSLVGTFAFGLFFYYGTRPVYRRVRVLVPYDGLAAALTLLLTALPGLILILYLGLQGLTELSPYLDMFRELLKPYVNLEGLLSQPVDTLLRFVRDPSTGEPQNILGSVAKYVGFVTTLLQTLFIATVFAFYLLRDGDRINDWFLDTVGPEGTPAHAYVSAVDSDLETIYFSNVLLVLLIAVLATVVYYGYNLLAPAPIDIPFPTAMALLTGFAALVPIIVGKVVYVPLVAYLGSVAARGEPSLLFPIGLFVVSFLFLDFIPLTFLLPALAGRETHVGVIMFAYILGVIIFGWYGLFLGPLLVVLAIQAVRIVLPELLAGTPVSPKVRSAEELGSDPAEADEEHPETETETETGETADGDASVGDSGDRDPTASG